MELWHRRALTKPWLFLIAMSLCQGHSYGQVGPQPPCELDANPPYPLLDDPPITKSWSTAVLGRDWSPPKCTGWATAGFTTLVTTASRFRYTAGAAGLLRHIGAASELSGIQYWSATHKRWRTLVIDAYALTGESGERRRNFTPEEMREGAAVFFLQADNLSGKATYRMHIAEASPDRVVFDIKNVSTIRYFLIPILHAEEMQSIYFLDRESDGVWRCYSMVRTGLNANARIAGNESSAINRAVAYFRHFIGIPTGLEPPAAR